MKQEEKVFGMLFAKVYPLLIAKVLQKLEPKENVFAVLGNHDPKSSTDEIKQFYKDAKIQLLIDQEVELKDFILIGRDDVMTNPKRKSLYEIEKDSSSRKPRIVIDHNPSGIAEAVARKTGVLWVLERKEYTKYCIFRSRIFSNANAYRK